VLTGLALAGPVTAPAAAAPAAAAPASVDGAATNGVTVLSAKAYPGIRLIEVDHTATVTLPDPVVDQKAINALSDRLAGQARAGAIAATSTAILDAFVAEIGKAPLTYFRPSGRKRDDRATVSGFGTGWVVTPDGYMVTAAHLVTADPQKIKGEFATARLTGITELAVAQLQSQSTFSDAQVARLRTALTTYAEKYVTVTGLTSTVSAQTGKAVAGFKKSPRGRPVEVKAVGQAYPGKDVALLKLDGEKHLPTLPVGVDGDVAQGDTLLVAGYAAASTFYSGQSTDVAVEPSVTQGPLTAVTTNSGGTPIFQTQASSTPGHFGGPVLDADSGKVVGLVVAPATDDKGAALEGREVVVPVSVVTGILHEHTVTPATSDTTTTYDRAVDAFYAQHYKAARPLFRKAASLYPGHPYTSDFITRSTAAIDAGQDRTPRSPWFWLLVGVVPVAAVAAGLVLVLRRRARGTATRTADRTPAWGPGGVQLPGQPQAWTDQYPPAPQQQPGYPQPQYPQPQYPQPDYPPAQYPQPDYPPAQYPEPDYPQTQYPQSDHPQPNYPPAEYPQPEHPPQPGYPQPYPPQPGQYPPQ
jgi:hypothetical protein